MQVDEYISESWDFQDDDSRRDFASQNISSVASYYFPSALDDRIFLLSRLLSVLFLITESLIPFDMDDGEEYIEALEAAVKGHWQPDESIPAVWMLCGIFDEVRAQDYMLADDIIETAFSHLRYVTCLRLTSRSIEANSLQGRTRKTWTKYPTKRHWIFCVELSSRSFVALFTRASCYGDEW